MADFTSSLGHEQDVPITACHTKEPGDTETLLWMCQGSGANLKRIHVPKRDQSVCQ